ncbi:MAG: response regulator transcription factor [Comamonas sp.]
MQQALTYAELTIAVVEDDEDIRLNVCSFLQKSGFQTWGAESAEDFYVGLLRQKADLVVVDLGLPGEDGLSLIQRLAAQSVPVVVLTARGDLESRIAGLNAGALQYFVKPADLHELVAGIRSQLRHVLAQGSKQASRGPEILSWRLDLHAVRLVAPNQSAVPLTSRELELVNRLVSANGGLVSKQDLLETMGYGHVEDGFHRIESQLTRLRRKTLQATGMALPIRAVFGKGLVFIV